MLIEKEEKEKVHKTRARVMVHGVREKILAEKEEARNTLLCWKCVTVKTVLVYVNDCRFILIVREAAIDHVRITM